ncbi:MAG: Protein of unknown function (DUF2510)/Domain of unknown function [Ilumatobacteraceae bacterium]|nr:Protein of unknown function (DUF2510)/Domain of unknown function [Ilumatobacteraceae bacterium]
MSGSAAAPGWYPDPWCPGALRWFDGAGWTPHAAGLGPGPAVGTADVYDAEKGAKAARWASWAFTGRAAVAALEYAVMPLLFGGLWDEMRETTTASGQAFDPLEMGGLIVIAQVAGLVIWAALAFLCVWSFRATRNARSLGLSTTFEPAWAVAGWLLPAANLVMPYLVVRDLFPEGHPDRLAAGWWWASEMTGAVMGMVAFGAALAAGPAAGGAFGAVAAAIILAAGIQGRRLAGRAAETHASLARAAGLG